MQYVSIRDTIMIFKMKGGEMKRAELVKQLSQGKSRKIREGTNHEIWYSEITGKTFAVPRHKKEIATGTANNILKDAGLK